MSAKQKLRDNDDCALKFKARAFQAFIKCNGNAKMLPKPRDIYTIEDLQSFRAHYNCDEKKAKEKMRTFLKKMRTSEFLMGVPYAEQCKFSLSILRVIPNKIFV